MTDQRQLLDVRDCFRPVAQTRRHSDDVLPHERGNCTQAALASLTGLALDLVIDHCGYCGPADQWQIAIRRWCRDYLDVDIDGFLPENIPPGWLGLAGVPSLNAPGAFHTVVVEVVDAGAVKVVWDPAQWPGRPTYDGRVLPTFGVGHTETRRRLIVEALCEPYDPDPDEQLADGWLAA